MDDRRERRERICLLQEEVACCCSCAFLEPDMSHPLTNGGSVEKRKGWVCAAPGFEGVYSGWAAHGLCEMFETFPGPAPPQGFGMHPFMAGIAILAACTRRWIITHPAAVEDQ